MYENSPAQFLPHAVSLISSSIGDVEVKIEKVYLYSASREVFQVEVPLNLGHGR